jgi:hypothetical protein
MRFIALQRPSAVLAWRAPLAVAGLIGLFLLVGALTSAQSAVAQDNSSGLDQYLERRPDAGSGSDAQGQNAAAANDSDDGSGSGAIVLVVALVVLAGGAVTAFVIQRRRGSGESAA